MAARLTLLCHASTPAVRRAAFPADESLEPREREKLAAMPHRLRGADFCLTSPAARAVETAQTLGLSATSTPALRDLDHGRWRGRSIEDVTAEEPDALEDWLRDPAAAPHGGETTLALIARVAAWLDERQAVPGVTIAVTHAAVIRAAIVAAIHAGPEAYARIDVAPLTIAKLSGHGGRWTLSSLGALKAEQISE